MSTCLQKQKIPSDMNLLSKTLPLTSLIPRAQTVTYILRKTMGVYLYDFYPRQYLCVNDCMKKAV